jgi:hypothetical protein
LDDGNFIISLVVLAVDASSAIESDKIIGGSSGLNLDDDRVVTRIVLIISNTNNVARPGTRGRGIEQSLGIVVPSDVPVLVKRGKGRQRKPQNQS